MKKGIIALDIDGTITAEHHRLPTSVEKYFIRLAEEGWLLVFITGRTFSWGFEVLKTLSFSYYFAVQNGAIILEMPAKRIISRKYLDRSILKEMDLICQSEPCDYVVYGGFEYNDVCYFRPAKFSHNLLHYVKERADILKETWLPVNSYSEMPIDSFASIKCFGKYSDAIRLVQKIESGLGLHVPLIRDPFNEDYFVVQAIHASISKGEALKTLIKLLGPFEVVIAAGDDLNDLSMLEVANVKVVMRNAPQEVLNLANIVAPPATEEGIIQGLQGAIKYAEELHG